MVPEFFPAQELQINAIAINMIEHTFERLVSVFEATTAKVIQHWSFSLAFLLILDSVTKSFLAIAVLRKLVDTFGFLKICIYASLL